MSTMTDTTETISIAPQPNGRFYVSRYYGVRGCETLGGPFPDREVAEDFAVAWRLYNRP